MKKFNSTKQIIEDNFFFINSKQLELVESKLYGYIVSTEGVITNDNFKKDFFSHYNDSCGAYIYVEKNQNSIRIYQDFIGACGIYLYKGSDGEFYMSNSFLLLTNKIKKICKLSFNYDYAYNFLNSDLCAINYSDTMINEIYLVPGNCIISIDLRTKELQYEYVNYQIETVNVDTREGINLLDKWYSKWCTIFRNIKSISNNVTSDLSGGFDSRLILSILLNSGIDLNTININTINNFTDQSSVQAEDYEIASLISEHYGFNLNNHVYADTYRMDDFTGVLSLDLYTRMCFHKIPYVLNNCHRDRLYSFQGYGGIRGYWLYTYKEFKDMQLKRISELTPQIKPHVERELEKVFTSLSKDSNVSLDDKRISEYLYMYTRARNHYGKSMFSLYLTNKIILSPLLDPLIQKLNVKTESCGDSNLLMATIFKRYAPDLLLFKFQGKRSIKESTINEAKKINERFGPYKPLFSDTVGTIDIFLPSCDKSNQVRTIPRKNVNLHQSIVNIVQSVEFKSFCDAFFYNEIYDKCITDFKKRRFNPIQQLYALLSLVKIIKDVIESNNNELGFDFENQPFK